MIVLDKRAHPHRVVLAEVQRVDAVIMLCEVQHEGVAVGVLVHDAVGRVGQVVVGQHGHHAVTAEERRILGENVRLAHVDDGISAEGRAVAVKLHLNVSGRLIGPEPVGLQVGRRRGGGVERTQEVAHVALLEFLQRDRLKVRHAAEGLVSVVRAESGPVVVGAEIDVFVVVPDQRVEHVDLDDILVFLFKLVGNGLALVVHTETVQQIGGQQDADAGGNGHVEEAHIVLLRDGGRTADHVGVEVGQILVEGELFKGRAADLQRSAVDDLFVVVAQAAPGLHRLGGRVDLLIIGCRLRCGDGRGLRRQFAILPFRGGRGGGRRQREIFRLVRRGVHRELGIVDHIGRDAVEIVHARGHLQPDLAAWEGVGIPGADAVEKVAVKQRFGRQLRKLGQAALLPHGLGGAKRDDQGDQRQGKEHREEGRGHLAAAREAPFLSRRSGRGMRRACLWSRVLRGAGFFLFHVSHPPLRTGNR